MWAVYSCYSNLVFLQLIPQVSVETFTFILVKFFLVAIFQYVKVYFPGGSDGKASVYNAEDLGSIPGSGRSPGEGNGNPLHYYCLENPTDTVAWQATVHRVAKSRTRLSDFTSVYLWRNQTGLMRPEARSRTDVHERKTDKGRVSMEK